MNLETIKKSYENGAKDFSASVVGFLLEEINKYKRANLVEINGWKGMSGVEISEMPRIFIVIEYRKSKKTGEVITQRTEVPKENVDFMENLLKYFGSSVRYRELISRLIEIKNLQCSIDAFNGGVNRSKFYFPLYYFPLKILESQKKIDYGGSGTIKILGVK